MKKVKFWIINQLNNAAEILMYGYIGEYEAIDDAAFISDLHNLEALYSDITIRVNCGGGDVYKGMTIFNAIRQSKADIKIKIDGIAASMGAIVPLAAKKGNVSMSKYARFMTHRVSGVAIGNADDMKNSATEMEQWEDNISDVLATRTGLSKEDAKKKYIVEPDRWIGAKQAEEEGLVDVIYDADPVTFPTDNNNAQSVFNAFQNKLQTSHPKKYKMKKELLKKLGLADDATDEQIDAAVEKSLTDKETAENSIKNAAKNKAKSLVNKAIEDKKIVESDRADYEAQAEANYDFVEKMLNKIPASKKPSEMLNRATGKTETDTTDDDTWEGLQKQGEKAVLECRENDFPRYKKLYEAYYKTELKVQG